MKVFGKDYTKQMLLQRWKIDKQNDGDMWKGWKISEYRKTLQI